MAILFSDSGGQRMAADELTILFSDSGGQRMAADGSGWVDYFIFG